MSPRPSAGYTKPTVKRSLAGFTLIELLVVIAVLVIMATWAVPNFQAFAARNNVNAEVMRIRTALALTRSAAVTRRTTVTLCPSANHQTCTNDDWTGTLVIIDGLASRGDIGGDTVLREVAGGRAVSVTYRNDGRPVRYKALGWATGHNGTFRICGQHGAGAKVIVSNFGRVRTTPDRPGNC